MAHTAGPWRWRVFGDKSFLVADYGRRKVVLANARTCDPERAENYLRDAVGTEPDMLLLAAAPDLYAVVKRAMELGAIIDEDLEELAVSALIKAEVPPL